MSSLLARPRRARCGGARLLGAMLAVMWVVEVIDAADSHRLDGEGIVPRDPAGLPGILFAPFLHASFAHLLANTVPFVVLGLLVALEGARRLLAVTAAVGAIGGLGTWLTAPGSSVTVGASGLVFGYASYLSARGFFSHRLGQLAVGVLVALLFGGALLWGLVPRSGISWQDHLFGALGGLACARWPAGAHPRRGRPAPRRPRFSRA